MSEEAIIRIIGKIVEGIVIIVIILSIFTDIFEKRK